MAGRKFEALNVARVACSHQLVHGRDRLSAYPPSTKITPIFLDNQPGNVYHIDKRKARCNTHSTHYHRTQLSPIISSRAWRTQLSLSAPTFLPLLR